LCSMNELTAAGHAASACGGKSSRRSRNRRLGGADVNGFIRDLHVALASTVNETEVRDRFCNEVYSKYDITFRLERGRSDARLNSVILEFKDKGFFRGKTNTAKFKEAYGQLTKKYIPNQAKADGAKLHEYVGIAIDCNHYAFVFFEENGKHRHTALLKLDASGILPLIDALQNDVRRSFTVENFLEDFGSESKIAKNVINELWCHLDASVKKGSTAYKTQMLFEEWKKLFSQAASLGKVGRSKIDTYLLSVGLAKPLDYAKALFTLHTYNALLFKLIAAEVVTNLRYKVYSGFAAEAAGLPCPALRDILDRRIEHAEVFIANNIENFVEGTFFSWYLENSPDSLLEALRRLLSCLAIYIFPTTTRDRIRDVVKATYQNLVPDALRKNIGEFYTPEWLVEFVLDQTGYKGKGILGKKLLDPCCGSGNFLIHAIARYKAEGKKAKINNLAKNILGKIIGFDLNPLAVISSRLNYLLAISDIMPPTSRIEIPVYMADAVYAPVRNKNGSSSTRSYNIGTVLGNIELVLPEKLVQRQNDFGVVLSIMERSIESDSSRNDFISHLKKDVKIKKYLLKNNDWQAYLGSMYEQIQDMEKQNWNRIWCRIVRNYFASVTIGKVNVIAGNPPWIRWSELPEDYRDRIKPTCERYAIFSQNPFFGGNELDISGMIAYTVTDKWLEKGGVLGFVITQIHFQAPSSEGFRCFNLPDGTKLGIKEVHDFTNVRPFKRLANKPAVFSWKSGTPTKYPVDYKVWGKVEKKAIGEDEILSQVKTKIKSTDKKAIAIPPDNRWSVLLPKHLGLVPKLKGGSDDWQGRKGITTDLNPVYFVELVGPGSSPGLVKIRTTPHTGKKPVSLLDRDIDADLVYPLLKGARQFKAFKSTSIDLVAIVPNKVITSIRPEKEFRRRYSATFGYFNRINQDKDNQGTPILESRSTWRKRMKPSGAPFYAIYNVGNYTFSPYKVVWAEMAGKLQAAVVSSHSLPEGIGSKPIVPDHKVYFVAADTEDEAHFLCSMLNSEPVNIFVNSFTVKIQVGTIFRHLKLPAFNFSDQFHLKMVSLSKQAHSMGIDKKIQSDIDSVAWDIVKAMPLQPGHEER